MQIPKVYQQLQLEDLPDDSREIAEIIGMEAFRAMVYYFGGTNIYVPMLRSFPKFLLRMIPKMKQEGYSIRSISQTLNVSQNTVRRYCGKN